jgi:hypothetical protein
MSRPRPCARAQRPPQSVRTSLLPGSGRAARPRRRRGLPCCSPGSWIVSRAGSRILWHPCSSGCSAQDPVTVALYQVVRGTDEGLVRPSFLRRSSADRQRSPASRSAYGTYRRCARLGRLINEPLRSTTFVLKLVRPLLRSSDPYRLARADLHRTRRAKLARSSTSSGRRIPLRKRVLRVAHHAPGPSGLRQFRPSADATRAGQRRAHRMAQRPSDDDAEQGLSGTVPLSDHSADRA